MLAMKLSELGLGAALAALLAMFVRPVAATEYPAPREGD
jgi:hypothetical protein